MNQKTNNFIMSASLSIVVNLYLLSAVQSPFSIQTPKSPPLQKALFQFTSQYVDTHDKKTPLTQETDMISDKNSQLDSALHGKDQGLIPKADIKELLSQSEKKGSTKLKSKREIARQATQEIKKIEQEENKKRNYKKIKNKTSILDDQLRQTNQKENTIKRNENIHLQKELEKIKNTDLSLAKEQNLKKDLFPLPFISVGNHTISLYGADSFATSGSSLGQYMKIIKAKIGLKFNQMVLFHYKTTYAFPSKVKIYFSITPLGNITDIKSNFVQGDPLFLDYCETVITGSAPFAPLPDNLSPYLNKKGMLDINFHFGFNVREKD